ncbi:hypothetical protein JHK87_055885 [Glycine soja]|nr:hypothetical protein JHK87_055885 [Glycine soja]
MVMKLTNEEQLAKQQYAHRNHPIITTEIWKSIVIQLLKKEVLKVVVHSFCFLGALGGCFLMQVLLIEYAKGRADCMRLNATR